MSYCAGQGGGNHCAKESPPLFSEILHIADKLPRDDGCDGRATSDSTSHPDNLETAKLYSASSHMIDVLCVASTTALVAYGGNAACRPS